MELKFEKVKTLPQLLVPGTIYWVDDLKTTVVAETEYKHLIYNGGKINIDEYLSSDSENPVMNKTITEKFNKIPFESGIKENSAVLKGGNNIASSSNATAFGLETKASGDASHAEGYSTHAAGGTSHAEGYNTGAGGASSHAEGMGTEATGLASHAEGYYTNAKADYTHAEGQETTASHYAAHAEGYKTTAQKYGHAEGRETKAVGETSHAEGLSSEANGIVSHAEGRKTLANGEYSHAEGRETEANGKYSHTEGFTTITYNEAEHASGKYNNSIEKTESNTIADATLFSIGIGDSKKQRKNAFEVKQNGDIYIEGVVGTVQSNINNSNTTLDVLTGDGDGSIKKIVSNSISNIIDSAPEAFDTLKEIADWIVEDETNSAELVKQVENNTKAIEDFSNMSFETTTNSTTVSETIPVAGGPLSDLLIAKGITSINKDSNLQDVLLTLFCKEEFPSISISTSGTFTGKSGLNGTTITCKSGSTTLSNSALVEPGTKLKFTVTQGSISGTYGSTSWSISGFKHGYSLDDDDTVDSTNNAVTHSWSVSGPNNTSYTLDATLNGTSKNASGSSTQTITFDEISAKIGNNTCSTTSKGTRQYTGTMEGFPTYYVVSNLGKTTDYDSNGIKRFTDPIEGKTTTVTSGNSSGVSSSKTIIGVYPVYHNVSSSSLGSDTTTKMSLSTSTSYTISNVPSEEASGKQFIFDFPENATVSSMSVKPLPGKYNVYSNISGNSIGSSLDYSHGVWKSSMVFNAAKESGSARFAIEFPASTNVTKVLRLNDATGKDDEYKSYKIESVKRGSDSYKRLTMTHDSAQGVSKYTISFETPGAESNTDYTIEPGVTKTINGTVYNYNRLITTSQQGWVDRTITFSKSLNNIS